MRSQFAAVIVVAFLSDTAVGTSLAELNADSSDKKLIRKEQVRKEQALTEDGRRIALESTGELINIQEHHQKVNPATHGDPLRAVNATWPTQGMSAAYCADVFPIGPMNSSKCFAADGCDAFTTEAACDGHSGHCTWLSDGGAGHICKGNWENVLDMGMCREAARQNGQQIDNHVFEIPANYYNVRPRGCFERACEASSNNPNPSGQCYFYNDKGDWPGHPDGAPICVEYKYTEGSHTTSGDVGVTCRDGYSPIFDEEVCDRASQCLGKCEGYEFRMAEFNATEYHDYPVGCFVHESTVHSVGRNCVFFNPRRNNTELPQGPRGTPICDIDSRRQETLDAISKENR